MGLQNNMLKESTIKNLLEKLDILIKDPEWKTVSNHLMPLTSFNEEIDKMEALKVEGKEQPSDELMKLADKILKNVFLLPVFICIRTDKKMTNVFDKEKGDFVTYTKCIFCNTLEHTCLIDNEEGTYTCSSCKESGTIIDFYAKYRNITKNSARMTLFTMGICSLEVVKDKFKSLEKENKITH